MSWRKPCSSALLSLALLAGCATAPKPEAASKAPPLPPVAVSLFEVGLVHLRAERYQEAAVELEKLTAEHPGYANGWANLGVAYAELGREEDAARVFNDVLTRWPGHPIAGNRLAVLHREAGRFAEARALYEAVLAASPDYAPAHVNLGILCDLYLRDLPCAQAEYQRYLELVGEDEQVSLWLLDLNRRMEEGE